MGVTAERLWIDEGVEIDLSNLPNTLVEVMAEFARVYESIPTECRDTASFETELDDDGRFSRDAYVRWKRAETDEEFNIRMLEEAAARAREEATKLNRKLAAERREHATYLRLKEKYDDNN